MTEAIPTLRHKTSKPEFGTSWHRSRPKAIKTDANRKAEKQAAHLRPNEKELSYRWRERAWIEMEVFS
jgi:hypothetical protein